LGRQRERAGQRLVEWAGALKATAWGGARARSGPGGCSSSRRRDEEEVGGGGVMKSSLRSRQEPRRSVTASSSAPYCSRFASSASSRPPLSVRPPVRVVSSHPFFLDPSCVSRCGWGSSVSVATRVVGSNVAAILVLNNCIFSCTLVVRVRCYYQNNKICPKIYYKKTYIKIKYVPDSQLRLDGVQSNIL
jgi:hypothetical protein